MNNVYELRKFNYTVTFLLLLFSFSGFGQVGIGTTDPKTTLDVNGALSLREGPELELDNGNNEDIDLGTTIYSQYRITKPTADFSIQSFAGTGNDGQLLTLINTTPHRMTIADNQGGDNGISCPGEKDLFLSGLNASVTFQYNSNESRWFVVSIGDSSSLTYNSVSFTGNTTISSITDYRDISGMSLEFTATNPSVLVSLSASGSGETDALSSVFLRVNNETTNNSVGGTNQNIQTSNFHKIKVFLPRAKSRQIPNWSASFEKLLTGLTVGTTYRLQVQGKVKEKHGTANATINTNGTQGKHLTLSVIQ